MGQIAVMARLSLRVRVSRGEAKLALHEVGPEGDHELADLGLEGAPHLEGWGLTVPAHGGPREQETAHCVNQRPGWPAPGDCRG